MVDMKIAFFENSSISFLYTTIRIPNAIKWQNLLVVSLLLVSVIISGCISQKPAENLTHQGNVLVSSSSAPTVLITTKSPVSSIPDERITETQKQKDDYDLAQNETAYYEYSNISFGLDLGNITFRKGGIAGNMSSYITDINLSVKNTGKTPIELKILVSKFMDDYGDGCHTNLGWCYGKDLGPISPGELKNLTVNVTFSSIKEYDYLSSQTYRFSIATPIETRIIGIYAPHFSWIIDMKNATIMG